MKEEEKENGEKQITDYKNRRMNAKQKPHIYLIKRTQETSHLITQVQVYSNNLKSFVFHTPPPLSIRASSYQSRQLARGFVKKKQKKRRKKISDTNKFVIYKYIIMQSRTTRLD